MPRKKTVFLLLLLSFCLTVSAGVPGFYVWHREYTPELKQAVGKFVKVHSGELLFLAAELENDGRVIKLVPPDFAGCRPFTAVVRIHINNMKNSPEQLASRVSGALRTWLASGCRRVQIDLDAPESKLSFYTRLLNSLRRKLPEDTTLSATVLPCHVSNILPFAALTLSCDYFVLQVHGAVKKADGKITLLESRTAFKALRTATVYNKKFKVALPFYAHRSSSGLISPPWHDVAAIARWCNKRKIPLLGFRLGHSEDGFALELDNALRLCAGKLPEQKLSFKLIPGKAGELLLQVSNKGFFAEDIIIDCAFPKGTVIDDFDTFTGCRAAVPGSPERLYLRLPPPGSSRAIMWLRSRTLCADSKITISTTKPSIGEGVKNR